MKFWKKRISFFITVIQRTKRLTELKILFKKKALIKTNFGNVWKYVAVEDLEEPFPEKYYVAWYGQKKNCFELKKVFLIQKSFL